MKSRGFLQNPQKIIPVGKKPTEILIPPESQNPGNARGHLILVVIVVHPALLPGRTASVTPVRFCAGSGRRSLN